MEQRVVRLFASRSEWLDRCPQEHCGESARTKIERKIDAKASQNRRKIDEKSVLGGFGRSGSLWGRSGVPPERPRNATKRARDRQERSRGRPGASKSAPGTLRASPERFQQTPRTPAEAFAVPSADGSARGSKFKRFRLDARKPGYAFRTTPASVLLMSDDVRFERQVGAKVFVFLFFEYG